MVKLYTDKVYTKDLLQLMHKIYWTVKLLGNV